MEPFQLEEKESFQVLGYRMTTTNQKKAGMSDIPAFWEKKKEEIQTSLLGNMNKEPYGVFGINVYNTNDKDARIFDYYIAVSSDEMSKEGMAVYQVPKALWAIFPCTRETIAKTEVLAITKYLPKSGYRPLNKGYITGKMKSGAPDIEHYGQGSEVEVWIAVEKK